MQPTIPLLAIALGAFAVPARAQTADWNLESPATAPTERVGYINVASDGSQMYVLGGKDSTGYRNDLWAYDGTDWTLLDDGTVSGPGLHPYEDGGFTCLPMLEGSGELEAIPWHHPIIPLCRGYQRRREARPLLNSVVG